MFTDELVPRSRTPKKETAAATATETDRQEIVSGRRPIRIADGSVRGRKRLWPLVRLRR